MEITNTFYLSLGSNLGDRLYNLQFAITILDQVGCKIRSVSSVYESEPLGFNAEKNFFNAALKGSTRMNAEQLMTHLIKIENQAGRERIDSKEYISRPLDLDIIFFNDSILQKESVNIPHPRFRQRKFVLLPLIEIDRNLCDPVDRKPLSEILLSCPDNSMIKRLDSRLIYR